MKRTQLHQVRVHPFARKSGSYLSGPVKGGNSTDKDCVQDCPEDWEANGQQCYFWSNQSKSWFEGDQVCRSKGGHLASANSNSTNDYILKGLAKGKTADTSNNLWIGGTDSDEEGIWTWTDGSAWEFTYWGYNRPGDNDRQNCLQYDNFNQNWWDWKCHTQHRFLCSKKKCLGKDNHYA